MFHSLALFLLQPNFGKLQGLFDLFVLWFQFVCVRQNGKCFRETLCRVQRQSLAKLCFDIVIINVQGSIGENSWCPADTGGPDYPFDDAVPWFGW